MATQLRWRDYFVWLAFTGEIFIASEALRHIEYYQSTRMYWLDVADALSLLAMVTVMVALAGALGFKSFESVCGWTNLGKLKALPQGLTFAFFVAAWLNIARLFFASNHLSIVAVPAFYQLLFFFAIGLAIFAFLGASMVKKMKSVSDRIGVATITAVVVFAAFTAQTFFGGLSNGQSAPVTLTKSEQTLPNVAIVILDGLGSRDMSLYGYSLTTTPNLDRIAQTWTVYENAHSSANATSAIMPALLTGRYPYTDDWWHYGDWVRSESGWLSMPQVLNQLGYEVAGFLMPGAVYSSPGKYHLQSGWSTVENAGRIKFPGRAFLNQLPGTADDTIVQLGMEYYPRPLQTESRREAEFAGPGAPFAGEESAMYAAAARYFRDRVKSPDSRSFLAYLHVTRPNGVYFGDEFAGTFMPLDKGLADAKSQASLRYKDYTASQQPVIDELRLRYDENIRKADDQVGILIEELKQSGLYDQTMIVITADHGTSFSGGYQGYGSPHLLDTEHSVPLLIKYPGQTAGTRETRLVSTVDIFPTVLDVVGASYPGGYFDGESLLSTDYDSQRAIYVRQPGSGDDVIAILHGNRQLVRRERGEKLFDLLSDPNEHANLPAQVSQKQMSIALDRFEDRVRAIRQGQSILKAPALISALPVPQMPTP